jgi:nucleoside-diphosphate-sugar epimerase
VARRALEGRGRLKVAITGAAGYVGSLLVRAHAECGDTVNALARDAAAIESLPGVTCIGVDLTQPGRIPASFFEHADVLYHCAAEIAREPLMRAVNVEATRALLAGAQGRIGHWVQVSSLSVYGRARSGDITEESPLRPSNTYGRTKSEADALLEELAPGAFSYTIVRPSGVIGPHMRNRSMYALISAVQRGRFAFVGRPGAIGNFVHEDNMRQALMLAATHPGAKHRTYNVSQNCTIEQMIDAIAAAIGRPAPRRRLSEALARLAAQAGRVLPRFPLSPGRVDALTSRVRYQTTRIERELGYRHTKSIEDGLRELAQRWQAGTA